MSRLGPSPFSDASASRAGVVERPISRGGAAVLLCAAALVALPATVLGQEGQSLFTLLDTGGRALGIARVADGALSGDDFISPEGRRVQAWTLGAAAGAELQVDLRSDDFDSYLYFVGPGIAYPLMNDDGGNGLNSRLCVALEDPGEYRVIASSLSGGTGSYTIEVRERPGALGGGVCPDEDAAPTEYSAISELPLEGRTLAVGDDVQGVLTPYDPLLYGTPAQAWEVQGSAGQRFAVDLISENFDAYLMADGPGFEEWLEDDDGAGRCDARLDFEFPENGSYRIVVTSIGANDGLFRLVTYPEPPEPDPDFCDTEATVVIRPAVVDVAVVGELEPEVELSGAMTDDDGTFDGLYSQAWTFQAAAAAPYTIELRSPDFDTYLAVEGPGFGPARVDLAINDDYGGELNSRLCIVTPAAGEYTVYASPYSGRQAGGRYTIQLSAADAEASCEAFHLSEANVGAALALLPTRGMSLGVDDELELTLEPFLQEHPLSNRPILPIGLDVPAGEAVFVDVVSADFDPVLYVAGPGLDGALFGDDFGDGCNSRLSVVSGGPGTVLLPGAYYQSAGGSFTLRVATDPPPIEAGGCIGDPSEQTDEVDSLLDPDAPLPDVDFTDFDHLSSGDDRRVEVGTEIEGFLGPNDETLSNGTPAQTWTVDLTPGEYVLELLADDFDPKLYLDPLIGVEPIMDDDGAGSLNSRIEYSVVAGGGGIFRLVVNAYTEGASGSFRLRVIRRAF